MATPLPKAFWPLTLTASNNKIDVRRVSDNADFLATVEAKTYYSSSALALAVQLALGATGWDNGWGCEVGGQNMCFNPSFEYDGYPTISGWAQFQTSGGFTYWASVTKMGNGQPAAPPNGIAALGMTWNVSNAGWKGTYTNPSQSGGGGVSGWRRGQTARVTFWASASGTNIGKVMAFPTNIAPGSNVAISNPPLSAVWQRYEWLLTWGTAIPTLATGSNGELYLSIAFASASTGSLYIDDVRVVSLDTATADKRGHIIIAGQDDFILRFANGTSAATSARDVLGFDASDFYSADSGYKYVLSPYQHRNAWYSDVPVRFDSKPRYDRVVSSEVSHSGRMKSVMLGSPREMRSIELGSLPAWKAKMERETIGSRYFESIERLWRDGHARFRWWSDAADESCGRDYRLDGDALTTFNPARERNTPEQYSYAMNLRRYVA